MIAQTTDLIAFVRNVITLMTNNPQYAAPTPSLATVTTSVNAFETAVHDALDGGKIATATRNAARLELLALMRQRAAYYTAEHQVLYFLRIASKRRQSIAQGEALGFQSTACKP